MITLLKVKTLIYQRLFNGIVILSIKVGLYYNDDYQCFFILEFFLDTIYSFSKPTIKPPSSA